MTRFVLVHGAWHGGWCWDRVAPRLRAAGHQTQAPTLTGLGERSAALTPEVGLATHVEDVVSALREGEEPAVLVGHSYSGLVVREAAALAPELLTEHPLRSFEEPSEREPPPELPQRAVLAAPGPVPMEEMARALLIPATRIEGGHDLMVTSPEALTTTLLESA